MVWAEWQTGNFFGFRYQWGSVKSCGEYGTLNVLREFLIPMILSSRSLWCAWALSSRLLSLCCSAAMSCNTPWSNVRSSATKDCSWSTRSEVSSQDVTTVTTVIWLFVTLLKAPKCPEHNCEMLHWFHMCGWINDLAVLTIVVIILWVLIFVLLYTCTSVY